MKDKGDKVKKDRKMTKRSWIITGITFGVLVIAAACLYAFGVFKFSASTTLPEIANTAYGTYSSTEGSGNVTSNEVKIQIQQ